MVFGDSRSLHGGFDVLLWETQKWLFLHFSYSSVFRRETLMLKWYTLVSRICHPSLSSKGKKYITKTVLKCVLYGHIRIWTMIVLIQYPTPTTTKLHILKICSAACWGEVEHLIKKLESFKCALEEKCCDPSTLLPVSDSPQMKIVCVQHNY